MKGPAPAGPCCYPVSVWFMPVPQNLPCPGRRDLQDSRCSKPPSVHCSPRRPASPRCWWPPRSLCSFLPPPQDRRYERVLVVEHAGMELPELTPHWRFVTGYVLMDLEEAIRVSPGYALGYRYAARCALRSCDRVTGLDLPRPPGVWGTRPSSTLGRGATTGRRDSGHRAMSHRVRRSQHRCQHTWVYVRLCMAIVAGGSGFLDPSAPHSRRP